MFTVLCAVWGKTYIERFAELSLASLLAPGNLPALGGPDRVEVVFLTGRADVQFFRGLRLMETLRRHARVRFVAIDDLIVPGLYSVTLTLAFHRGVRSAWTGVEEGRSFIFWNADFVLAEGGLANVARRVAAGQRLIMTGTLRALSPFGEQALAAAPRLADGGLSLRAADLVRLAVDWPQQHHAAKVINQSNSWSAVPSQMFWRVGDQAMLGRFYQAFMLCLTPTRVPDGINGPCDYSFMPEYCPGEPVSMIADSDELFALEMGEAEQEAEHVRTGSPRDEDERVANMNEWLTAQHAETARTCVVFRARDVSPSDIEDAQRRLAAYHSDFMGRVRAPNGHANPYYWTWGVAAWLSQRDRRDPTLPLPAELAEGLSLGDLRSPTYDRRKAMFAREPQPIPQGQVSPLNPASSLMSLAAEAARTARRDRVKSLLVARAGEAIDAYLPFGAALPDRVEPNVLTAWALKGPPLVDHAVMWLTDSEPFDPVRLTANAAGAMAPGASVTLFVGCGDPLAYPGWLDAQARAMLPLAGMLEGFAMRTVTVPRAQVAYEARARRALHGLRHDPRFWMKPWALTKLALAAARRLVGGRGPLPVGIVASGRLRGPQT